jgi:hypothetical protein
MLQKGYKTQDEARSETWKTKDCRDWVRMQVRVSKDKLFLYSFDGLYLALGISNSRDAMGR